MANTFKAWDFAVWQYPTNGLYAYDGGAWRTATKAWAFDGSSWRLGYTTNGNISGLAGFDPSADPPLGNLDITWTVTGDVSMYTYDLDVDFAGGTSYGFNKVTGGDPTTGVYNAAFFGDTGFTTLNSTNIRLRLMDGVTVVTTLTANGPWPS